MKRKAITITLPNGLYQVIKIHADKDKRTLSSMIEVFLEDRLKEIETDEEETDKYAKNL